MSKDPKKEKKKAKKAKKAHEELSSMEIIPYDNTYDMEDLDLNVADLSDRLEAGSTSPHGHYQTVSKNNLGLSTRQLQGIAKNRFIHIPSLSGVDAHPKMSSAPLKPRVQPKIYKEYTNLVSILEVDPKDTDKFLRAVRSLSDKFKKMLMDDAVTSMSFEMAADEVEQELHLMLPDTKIKTSTEELAALRKVIRTASFVKFAKTLGQNNKLNAKDVKYVLDRFFGLERRPK